MDGRGLRLLVLVSILAALTLGMLNVWLSDLNQDEGWYLYAARLVAKGEMPYRDFAFTQPPVMTFAYLAALPFVDQWGVLGGRYFTMLLALSGAGVAAWAASRIAPSEKNITALATFILIAVNCYNSHYTAVVKTYALCGFLLSAGMLFLTWKGSRHGFLASLLSGVFLALAAGTRISFLVLLPIVFFWLIAKSRKGEARHEWAGFGIGAGITLALVFIPFLVASPENFIFFNITYHTARDVGGLLAGLVYKAGFLSRWAGGYSIAFLLALALLLRRFLQRRAGRRAQARLVGKDFGTGMLWTGAAALSLVHFLAPFPYDDYQVAVFPLFAIALGVGGVQLAFDASKSRKRLHILLWGLLAASLISSFSSPINQDWFVSGRDLIWWRFKQTPDIVKLREAGAWLREESGRTTKLLTQDTYLAVESGLTIPQELAMGPFSYYPDLDNDAARALNVCNREIMTQLIAESDASVAAFSQYAFAISSPDITPLPEEERRRFLSLLEDRFERVGEVSEFGQAHTRLDLYRAR